MGVAYLPDRLTGAFRQAKLPNDREVTARNGATGLIDKARQGKASP